MLRRRSLIGSSIKKKVPIIFSSENKSYEMSKVIYAPSIDKFISIRKDSTYTWYSENGTSWTSSAKRTSQTTPYGIAFDGDETSVIVGPNHYISYNKTGYPPSSAYTRITVGSGGLGTWVDVIYACGKFVAIDDQGRIYYSTDGSTWNICTLSGGSSTYYQLRYSKIRFIKELNLFMLQAGTNLLISEDGISWIGYENATNDGNVPPNTLDIQLVYFNNMLLAIKPNYAIWKFDQLDPTSGSAIWETLSSCSLSISSFYDVINVGGTLVGVASSGKTAYSFDAINWVENPALSSGGDYYSLAYNGKDTVVATGSYGSAVANI